MPRPRPGRCATSGRNGCERPATELDRVEQEVAAARAAHATTAAKILEPSLPDPPAVDHALAADLDHVVGLADAGHWDDAVAHLDQWSTTAAATRRRGCRLNDRLPRADDRA